MVRAGFCRNCISLSCIVYICQLSQISVILTHIWAKVNLICTIRWQGIIWTNVDHIHWQIYSALGGDERQKIYFTARQHFYAPAFRHRRHYVLGLSVCPFVRLLEAWNTLFSPVHGSVGPSDQLWPFCGMFVRLSVHPSVRPSVSGHLPEKAWKEWPECLHAILT